MKTWSLARAHDECLILHRGRTLKSDAPAFVSLGAGPTDTRLELLGDFVGDWACRFDVVRKFWEHGFRHSRS